MGQNGRIASAPSVLPLSASHGFSIYQHSENLSAIERHMEQQVPISLLVDAIVSSRVRKINFDPARLEHFEIPSLISSSHIDDEKGSRIRQPAYISHIKVSSPDNQLE
jgi:hypothetical protein